MTQPPDHYKERELKYKRFDVYFRAIGAIAAVASAIAAFPVLKNVFSPEPASVQKSSIVTPANPSPSVVTNQPSSSIPATGYTKANQTFQQVPQVVPAKPQPSLQRHRDDDNDDRKDNDDDKRDNKRDDND